MAGHEELRETMGMSEWTDKGLVHMLARRFTEQSIITQLREVSVEEGTAYGVELLLRPEMEGERPDDIPRDGVLDAMIMEARRRIADRMERGAYRVNG